MHIKLDPLHQGVMVIAILGLGAGCNDHRNDDSGNTDCNPSEAIHLGDVPESDWPAGDNFGSADVIADFTTASGTWSVTIDCPDDSSYSGTAVLAFGGCSDPADYYAEIFEPTCWNDADANLLCDDGWLKLSGWDHGSYDGAASVKAVLSIPDFSAWTFGSSDEAAGDVTVQFNGSDSLDGSPIDHEAHVYGVSDDAVSSGTMACNITFESRMDDKKARSRRPLGAPRLSAEPPSCRIPPR